MGADVRRRACKIVASVRVVRHRREVGLPRVAAVRRVLVFKSEKRADSHSFTKNQIDVEFAAVALCGGGSFCSAGDACVFWFFFHSLARRFRNANFFPAATRPGFLAGFVSFTSVVTAS